MDLHLANQFVISITDVGIKDPRLLFLQRGWFLQSLSPTRLLSVSLGCYKKLVQIVVEVVVVVGGGGGDGGVGGNI